MRSQTAEPLPAPRGVLDPLLDALEDRFRRIIREELHALSEEPETAHSGPVDEEYITADRAAEIAGVQPATIRHWITTGKIREYRAGRLLRVRRGDLDLFLSGSRRPASANVGDIEARKRKALQRLK